MVGAVVITTVTEEVAVQPPLVTATVYVPAIVVVTFVLEGLRVVAVYPPGPVQA